MRSDTQQRLLDVHAEAFKLTERSRVQATPTCRRLQALAALGWPLPALALRRGRNPGNLRRTLTTATVTVTTAQAIASLYDALRDTVPPTRTPAEQTAATDTREQARSRGWLPPLAWDDIDADHDPHASDHDDLNVNEDWLDEIAVERAMNGDHTHLTRRERDEAITRLTTRGMSARRIAELLETSSRTVVRRRSAQRAA